jgi:arylsulfatase A-like enzyme/Flp pilus assembly protein TadD
MVLIRRSSIVWMLVCTLVSALSAAAQVTPPEAPPPPSKLPNIILITLDTTRADRMDFLGSNRGLTPSLDALANDSAVFTRAYAQAPLTPTSHATILTGTYPQFHQVVPSPDPLSKDLPYLPDILKARGYATGAFIGSLALNLTLTPGFDRGFDVYDADYSWKGYTPATRYQTIERRGGEVVERALAWLNKQQSSKQQHAPFFIWIHLFDPHDPYDPPEPYKTRYAKEPYDGEIAYVDSVMGNFFKQLKASGLYDGALIALTADHGESLGAHGEDTHGIFLYDETIHVPLVIKLPGKRVRPRIESRVELADILPTVLENVGIDVPKQVQGLSLLKLMDPGPTGEAAAEAWRDRTAYSQADYGRIAYGWSSLQSLRSGKYLYIQAPRRELYDDGLDPNAKHNLASGSPAVADTLSIKLETFRQETANPHPTTLALLDDTRTKELASLGYMANLGSSPATNPAIQRADPKDVIELSNVIYKANRLLEDLRCLKAVPKIQEMILTAPKVAPLHFFIGRCYFQENSYEKAVPEFRAAVQLDPSFVQDEMDLGIALMKLHNFDEAASAFGHVLKTDPTVTDAHVYLIVLYGKTNRTEDQIRECHAVLKLLPDNFGANLNLGQALLKTGDLKGAIAPLQKAIIGQPQRPAPHEVLADVYQQLGRQADADRERTEAERLRSAMSGATGAQQQ